MGKVWYNVGTSEMSDQPAVCVLLAVPVGFSRPGKGHGSSWKVNRGALSEPTSPLQGLAFYLALVCSFPASVISCRESTTPSWGL